MSPESLSMDSLRDAVRGSAAAIRLRVRLQPAGGGLYGVKIFPPTYAGGVYATEKRRIGDKIVECVLLDSVQSQANRLEQALLQAYLDGKLKFPLLSVEFPAELPDVGEVTTLDAPHRIFDAILRDSEIDGKEGKILFRSQLKAGGAKDTAKISDEGQAISKANVRNATPLFELCPTALIFGAWDSTGAAGGLGNKFARALTSEIVGVGAVYGVKTGGRLDPYAIEKGEIYEGKADGSYVVDRAEAKEDEHGEKVLFKRKGEKGKDSGTPAEINHGNIPPDLARYDLGKDQSLNTPDPLRPDDIVRKGNVKVGGVTIEYADQTTVLSLSALRRLRFPAAEANPISADDQDASKRHVARTEADHAARTVLAALALAAIAHQIDPPDYFLRSNCQLVLEAEPPVFEIVFSASRTAAFTLTADQADSLFKTAVDEWKSAWKAAWNHEGNKLPWREKKLTLTPKKALVDLVRRSRELGGGEA